MANQIALAAALALFAGGSFLVPALFWVFAIVAVAAYNITLKRLSNVDSIERFRKILADAEARFDQAKSDWNIRAGDGAFYNAKRKFEVLRTTLNEIPTKRIQALDQLKQDQRQLQLNHFLDGFDLEDAQIKGIGPGRKRTLASYAIETAADIVPNRVNAVPGFGPKMLGRLMKWRKSLEAKFVFNPAKTIDPRDIAKVEGDILALRTRAEVAAKAAHAEVLQAHAHVLAVRQGMTPQLNALQVAVAQARADYEFVKG
jgi:DNA-binding helix-hairpin-helix protein with protein kinase domain